MALTSKELDDLKPQVEKAVYKFLGFDEPTLATSALNCLDKGYDRKKTVYKLEGYLDGSKASKLADKLFDLLEDFKASNKHKSRKRKDDRPNKFEEDYPKVQKKKKFEEASPVPDPGKPSPGQLTADKIKDMMANAQKLIAQRKQELNIVNPVLDSVEKAKRAMELQARIHSSMSNAGMQPISAQDLVKAQTEAQKQAQFAKPAPLILDEYGRTIDATTGEAIQLSVHTPTLKANIRAKRREQFKSVQDRAPDEISESHFFDNRVSVKQAIRTKRQFKFHDKGKFEAIAQKLRTKAQLERLQSEISYAAKRTGIASAAKLATIQPKGGLGEGEIPTVEWWDSVILTVDSYGQASPEVMEGITNLVEHPTQMKPPADSDKDPQLPVMLTKKERKKLRRQNRNEIQKESQEKIRLGLLPPPEPKVRMANLMRVLGSEAIQDPTKIEAHVRAQMAKRQKGHEEANASRKLTTNQRKEKKARKMKEDTSKGVNVSIYRLRSLSNPSHKFKIEANCKQLFMTGFVILYKDCNVVVVEGGPKQQKKFQRLMLHRISWKNEKKNKDMVEDDNSDDEDAKMKNACVLVWEGTTKTRAFSEIIFKTSPTQTFAREQFRKHGVEEYWDLAFKGSVLEAAREDI